MRKRTGKSPKSSNKNNFSAVRSFGRQADDFFAARKGMVVIALVIVVATFLFNTVFGDLLGMVVSILVLVLLSWIQKWYVSRHPRSI